MQEGQSKLDDLKITVKAREEDIKRLFRQLEELTERTKMAEWERDKWRTICYREGY